MRRLTTLLVVATTLWYSTSAFAGCALTTDTSGLSINPAVLGDLKEIHVDEAFIWAGIQATSKPETNGCWAAPTGNSDKQILSVGVQQWNFGQNSLQPLLRLFQSRPGSAAVIQQTMPTYGTRFFSDGCKRLSGPQQLKDYTSMISQACFDFISSHYAAERSGLAPDFAAEVTALFESPLMKQVQVDEFSRNISVHKTDLENFFGTHPTPLDIKWVIDITTQQGGMPPLSNAQHAREVFRNLSDAGKQTDLQYTVEWYESSCQISDAAGVGRAHSDCAYNIPRMKAFVSTGAWRTQNDAVDLLILTRMKSRTAAGLSGIYQANCFERRAQVALGCGMVAGRASSCSFFAGDKGKLAVASQQ